MSKHTAHRPARVSTPVAPRDRLQEIWSQLSAADRHVVLGHDRDELSQTDRTKLVKVLDSVARKRRR